MDLDSAHHPKNALVLKVVKAVRSTLFMKLNDLYPECQFLIEGAPQLSPLFCLKSHCPRNQACMEKLANRVKYVFDTFPDTELLLLYFRYVDKPGSQRAGVFWRDMREPRIITFNRTAWDKLKSVGIVYEWALPDSLFLTKRS